MSWFFAQLFSRIQAASFYEALHREAVNLLPEGQDKVWLDVGCGPGLVARLAASRGYRATGIDIDEAMVRVANANKKKHRSSASYELAGLETLSSRSQKADVVSATSFLAVMRDRPTAMRKLLSGLKPDGVLLLVEPSEAMTLRTARANRSRLGLRRDWWALNLWARTRNPDRAVRWNDVQMDGYETQRHPLLAGLVNAWIIRPIAQVPANG